MSKYTAEQVEDYAQACALIHKGPVIAEMLHNYAALLRERESAKAGVTDEVVEQFKSAFAVHSTISPAYDGCINDALEAVAPMLASARVPDGWQPTPANVNALPAPIRKYIMMLETEADPAGTIRQNILVSEENDMLRAALTEALEAAPKPEKE